MAVKIIEFNTCVGAVLDASDSLLKDIKSAKRPLLLLSGGSSLNVARAMFEKLPKTTLGKLTVGQIDARFVSIDDPASNWLQIEKLPLPINDLRGAVSILSMGEEPSEIAANYSARLEEMMEEADKIFGLYGIGPDGHLAGMLPQKNPEEFTRFVDGRLVVSYKARDFTRITTTDALLARLDKAYVFACGPQKAEAVAKLNEDLFPREHPAQFIKDAPEAIVYYGSKEK